MTTARGKSVDNIIDVKHSVCDNALVKSLHKCVKGDSHTFVSLTVQHSCGESNAAMQNVHKNFSQDSCDTVFLQNRHKKMDIKY